MINRDKLKPVIEKYKTYFPTHWRNSIDGGVSCKWEAVKCFREHWDIDAPDCITRINFATCTDFFRHRAGDFLPPYRSTLPLKA